MKTKKTKLLVLGLVALAIFMNTACDKVQELGLEQEALGCADWAEQVSDELTAFNTAGSSYGGDPTPANCNNFKAAAKNYYEALEGLRECAFAAGVNQANFDAAIAGAKNQVAEVDCGI